MRGITIISVFAVVLQATAKDDAEQVVHAQSNLVKRSSKTVLRTRPPPDRDLDNTIFEKRSAKLLRELKAEKVQAEQAIARAADERRELDAEKFQAKKAIANALNESRQSAIEKHYAEQVVALADDEIKQAHKDMSQADVEKNEAEQATAAAAKEMKTAGAEKRDAEQLYAASQKAAEQADMEKDFAKQGITKASLEMLHVQKQLRQLEHLTSEANDDMEKSVGPKRLRPEHSVDKAKGKSDMEMNRLTRIISGLNVFMFIVILAIVWQKNADKSETPLAEKFLTDGLIAEKQAAEVLETVQQDADKPKPDSQGRWKKLVIRSVLLDGDSGAPCNGNEEQSGDSTKR